MGNYIYPINSAMGLWERGHKANLAQQQRALEKATYIPAPVTKTEILFVPTKNVAEFKFTESIQATKQHKKRGLWSRIKWWLS